MLKFFELLKDKRIRRSVYMILFMFAFMIVYEAMTAPPNPEVVIPKAAGAQMVSMEAPNLVVELDVEKAKAILDQNIRPWTMPTNDNWIYRITFDPGSEKALDVVFGDVWLQLGEYTYVVQDGTAYSEILDWARQLYEGK